MFPSGQLGGDEQIQRSLKSGTVHMGSIASSNMSIVSDACSWGDLPFVFKSPESAQKVFNDPAISEGISKKMRADTGTVVLGHIEVGGFRILINTKRPLKSPADIDGMKFRMLANPIDEALLSSWGASPVAMPWSEVFVSIEQGVADGLQLQPQAIAGFGFDKMIRYGTHTKTLMTVHVAQMNAAAWDGLSPEHQQLIRDASAEALKMANDADRADAAKFMEQLSRKIEFYISLRCRVHRMAQCGTNRVGQVPRQDRRGHSQSRRRSPELAVWWRRGGAGCRAGVRSCFARTNEYLCTVVMIDLRSTICALSKSRWRHLDRSSSPCRGTGAEGSGPSMRR